MTLYLKIMRNFPKKNFVSKKKGNCLEIMTYYLKIMTLYLKIETISK